MSRTMSGTSGLVATVLTLCVALGACSSGSDEPGGPEDTGGASASTDASGTATPTEPVPDGDDAITVGDFRYRPACRLFTPADAIELLPLTQEADFSQNDLAASVTAGDQSGAPLATTSCRYGFGDADRTTASLVVQEYASEQEPRSRWASIRRFGEKELPPAVSDGPFAEFDAAMRAILEDARASVGGVRVPGIDDRILWRIGSSQFVATSGNLLLTFDRGVQFGLTSTLTERDAALAEQVLLRSIEHAEDEDLSTTPVPPFVVQDDDWPTFLDPCTLLDAAGAEALLGGRPETVSTSSVDVEPDVNLAADSPAGRSHDNSCEWRLENRATARLDVQYVAPGDTAEDVLDSHLANLAFGDPTPTQQQVERVRDAVVPGGLADVDASYVFVVSGKRSSFYSYLLLDRYLLELTGSLPQGKYGSTSVDTLSLREAGQLVAANLAAAVAADDG